MVHPDYKEVAHLAEVKAARRAYVEAANNNRGSYENGGRQQKEAENALNRAIEKALSLRASIGLTYGQTRGEA